MAAESPADRLVFLSADDFGCTCSYAPVGGGAASTLPGVFDNDFLDLAQDGEAHVATQSPRMTCRSADLVGGGNEGDTLTIITAPSQPDLVGRIYKVMVSRPDGTGMTLLQLERVT